MNATASDPGTSCTTSGPSRVWWRDDAWRIAERITLDDGTAYWAVFDTRADTAPPQQGPVPSEEIVQWALKALRLKGIVPTSNANLMLVPEPE